MRILSLLLLVAALPLHAQNRIYAVVLGNQQYVVGSSTLHSGLYRSIDGGNSWTHLGPQNLKAFSMDAVDTTHGRILYIAAGNGVHRSTDWGETWKVVTDWRMTEVLDVTVDQAESHWIYAATAHGFWRSSDGGDSWENPPGPINEHYVYRIDELSFPGGIYASTADGVFESLDYGSTWRALIEVPAARGVFSIAGTTTLVATALGPLMVDASQSIAASQPTAPVTNTYAISFDRTGAPYAAAEDGVWALRAMTGLNGWRKIDDGLPTGAVHAIAYDSESGRTLAGTFGNGIYLLNGNTWVPSGLEGSQVWRIVVKSR